MDLGSDLAHYLFWCGPWAKNAFKIFKPLTNINKRIIFGDIWELCEILISVSINTILLEYRCAHLFTIFVNEVLLASIHPFIYCLLLLSTMEMAEMSIVLSLSSGLVLGPPPPHTQIHGCFSPLYKIVWYSICIHGFCISLFCIWIHVCGTRRYGGSTGNATEIVQLPKSKIFTLWPFIAKVCRPLV